MKVRLKAHFSLHEDMLMVRLELTLVFNEDNNENKNNNNRTTSSWHKVWSRIKHVTFLIRRIFLYYMYLYLQVFDIVIKQTFLNVEIYFWYAHTFLNILFTQSGYVFFNISDFHSLWRTLYVRPIAIKTLDPNN